MLQINSQSDPIVEILRLAYRRGLAIQREQEEKGRTVNPQTTENEILVRELEDSIRATGTKEVRTKVSK